MIKYKAVFWSFEVSEKIVSKETENFVVFKDGRREAKETRYDKYFDTEAEALKFLINGQVTKAESLERSLEQARANVHKLSVKLAATQQRHGAQGE